MNGPDNTLFPGPMEHLTAFALVLLAGVVVGAALVVVTYHSTQPGALTDGPEPRD